MFGLGRKAREAKAAAAAAAEAARVEAVIARVVEDEMTRETFRANRDARLAACNAREEQRYGSN